MRILMINSVCGIKSTGRICTDLASHLEACGHEVKIAYGRGEVPPQYAHYAVKIGNQADTLIHSAASVLLDAHGLASVSATKRFLKWADTYNPDLLWLHNIHGYYIHYPLLFAWIKSRPAMRVRWTLHDCWPFTGHCAYFTFAGCQQWKSECTACPQYKKYPASLMLDKSRRNFNKKREAFCGVKDMTIITPSQWLASLLKESFLKEYPTLVAHNTVDLSVFKPRESAFRQVYSLENKKIILGVAGVWDERKGLKDFIELSHRLNNEWQIVLVGLAPKQIKRLPDGIIGLPQTVDAVKLAELYSAADVFVNPTYEDNYPTTNLEAIACGTPVVTYRSGGSAESALLYGAAVETGNVAALAEAMEQIVQQPPTLTVTSLDDYFENEKRILDL